MFTWLRQAMARRAAVRQARQLEAQRLATALMRQVQAATTLRHLALVQSLAQSLLPARLRAVFLAALAQRLMDLPAPLVAPSPGSRRSSSSRGRTGRRTSKQQR